MYCLATYTFLQQYLILIQRLETARLVSYINLLLMSELWTLMPIIDLLQMRCNFMVNFFVQV